MYSLAAFGSMIADPGRMEPFAEALRRAVRPGCVVVDIGTGPGIFALLACRFGAGHVHAIETDNSIQLAREAAQANGCADRITFWQAQSTAVHLPERADVIISDLRGALPLYTQHLPSIVDARTRLLAPGGTLVGQADEIWLAPVEAANGYGRFVDPWDHNPYGLDFSGARRVALNGWYRQTVSTEQLMADPAPWVTLDYTTLTSPHANASVEWRIGRAGLVHGLAGWFDACLAAGVRLSNAPGHPGRPEAVYGHGFFPFLAPVTVSEGDHVAVDLRAQLVGSDYVWSWNSTVRHGGPTGPVLADFRQSTMAGTALSPAKLRLRSAGHAPRLGSEGEATRFALERMDGRQTLGEVAAQLAAAFPERFPEARRALDFVGELSESFARMD